MPFSSGNPGIFTFSGDGGSTPTLTQVAADDRPGAAAGNHALRVAYTIGGYGGFSHDLASPQDWSAYDGFSFWVKGTGSGQTVEFEVKDGGPDAENAELWQSFFTDDTNGWKKVQVAFAKHEAAHRLPAGRRAERRQSNLTKMWGYAVNLPGGGATNTLEFDDVQVYQSLQIDRRTSRARTRSPIRHGRSPAAVSSPGAATRAARRRCRSRSSTGPA